jgi:hypothetical protein
MTIRKLATVMTMAVLLASSATAQGFNLGNFVAPSVGNLDAGASQLQGTASLAAIQSRAATLAESSNCEERYRSFAARNGMSPSRRRHEALRCLEAAAHAARSDVAQND